MQNSRVAVAAFLPHRGGDANGKRGPFGPLVARDTTKHARAVPADAAAVAWALGFLLLMLALALAVGLFGPHRRLG